MHRQNFQHNAAASQKPEYVLQRANDLIKTAIGSGDREKRLALDHLNAHLSSKRNNRGTQWNKVYETLMKRHLELCVDLRDDVTAKDGLHQYRFLSLQLDPHSLETVVFYLIDMAEARAQSARTKADKVALAAAAKIQDLDQEATPESIMLSSMTDEGSRDRTDREVMVPWLKFLWEIYRAVLELLYKHAKLEKVYHSAASRAFNFCHEYQRNLEFKRLCNMLREHLNNLQKPPNKNSKQTPWEWTPEAVEYHLQTRFHQLEVATKMELWNESFKTVEEIYTIIVIGKKTPKPKIMSTYYEKLTRIFWVSGNHLFHAYCWYRYYSLSCDHKKDLTDEERSTMASSVLLAALCIPSVKDVGVDAGSAVVASDENDAAYEKNARMAQLLDFQANPTRHSLLQDILNKGVLNCVGPELKELYNIMEVRFHPLKLAAAIKPAVAAVKASGPLAMYATPLQRVAVIRVLLQLSHVFSTVKIDFVRKILSPLDDVNYLQIERIMVEGIARKDLQVKIDHAGKCLRFSAKTANAKTDADSGAVTVENTSATVAAALFRVANLAKSATPDASAQMSKAETQARTEFLMKVLSSAESEHATLQGRKNLIERRKEGLERIQNAKAEADRIKKDRAAADRKKDEDERLVLEEAARELDKKKKLNDRMEIIRIQKELEKYGVMLDEAELTAMDKDGRALTLADARKEAEKSKTDEERRVQDQAKRLDHITRALRIEGAKAIGPLYQKAVESDRAAFEAKIAAATAAGKEKHAQNLSTKSYLQQMQAYRALFETDIVAAQRAQWEKECEKIKERAIKEERSRRLARARQALAEEQERQQEEEEAERDREAQAERDRIEAEQHRKLREQREVEEEAERNREAARERELAANPPKPTFGDRRGMGMGGGDRSEPPARGGMNGGFGGGDREGGGGFRQRGADGPSGGFGGGRGGFGGDRDNRDSRDGGDREDRPDMESGDSWGRVRREQLPPARSMPPAREQREPSGAVDAGTWGRKSGGDRDGGAGSGWKGTSSEGGGAGSSWTPGSARSGGASSGGGAGSGWGSGGSSRPAGGGGGRGLSDAFGGGGGGGFQRRSDREPREGGGGFGSGGGFGGDRREPPKPRASAGGEGGGGSWR
jgi:translation initiation factor 3 subunit A